ncbi:hypothetical protein LX36DRAFT_544165, partial [Colletotrichum falcatum]
GRRVVNDEALWVIDHYYFTQLQHDTDPEVPKKLTIHSSDPYWPELQKTTFYKAIAWTLKGTGKIIESIDVIPRKPS